MTRRRLATLEELGFRVARGGTTLAEELGTAEHKVSMLADTLAVLPDVVVYHRPVPSSCGASIDRVRIVPLPRTN